MNSSMSQALRLAFDAPYVLGSPSVSSVYVGMVRWLTTEKVLADREAIEAYNPSSRSERNLYIFVHRAIRDELHLRETLGTLGI